jgi:hypothetical protein
MSDGRPASAVNRDWLELLCAPDLQVRVAQMVSTGAALATLVAEWSALASRLIGEFERGLSGRGLPEDLLDVIARHAGVAALMDLGEEFARLADAVFVASREA